MSGSDPPPGSGLPSCGSTADSLCIIVAVDPGDAAHNAGASLPPCFAQYRPDLAHPPDYRVVNFDLNWAGINVGSRGTAPAVRVTIAGPDGAPMIAAVPQGPSGNSIACQTVRSFHLGRQTSGWQLVYGLTLRVPLHATLDHLLVTADGHTLAVPLVPACATGPASGNCFLGDQLGGPWIAGTPYSASLRT